MLILSEFSNEEAEQILLGSLIMGNHNLSKVSDILKSDHFFFDSNKKIYEVILRKINLENVAADMVTLTAFFKELPEGFDYLKCLMAQASHIVSLRSYALELIELAGKRTLAVGLHELNEEIRGSSIDILVTKMQNLLSSLDSETSEVEIFDGGSLEQSLLNAWQDGSSSMIIPSGISKLDEMLNGGFTIDKLYTIGAAPGVGKTSFAQQVIINALEKGIGTLFFSMEMERKNLFVRFLAMFCKVNPFRILINRIFKHEQDSFDDALKKWNSLKSNYFMTEKGHLSLKKMESTLKRKLKANPVKLVVVDYIQIMELRDGNNFNEASLIKENVRGLKELATKYHVCVISLSQIVKDALGGKPGLKSLKGSGGIAEDSDCVINLWTEPTEAEAEGKKIKLVNVEIAKNRNGMLGSLSVNFDGEFNIFTEKNF